MIVVSLVILSLGLVAGDNCLKLVHTDLSWVNANSDAQAALCRGVYQPLNPPKSFNQIFKQAGGDCWAYLSNASQKQYRFVMASPYSDANALDMADPASANFGRGNFYANAAATGDLLENQACTAACDDSERTAEININVLSSTQIYPGSWDPTTPVFGGTLPVGLGWEVSSSAECKALCDAEPRCNAWQTDMPLVHPDWHPQGFCWLSDKTRAEIEAVTDPTRAKSIMGVKCAGASPSPQPATDCPKVLLKSGAKCLHTQNPFATSMWMDCPDLATITPAALAYFQFEITPMDASTPDQVKIKNNLGHYVSYQSPWVDPAVSRDWQAQYHQVWERRTTSAGVQFWNAGRGAFLANTPAVNGGFAGFTTDATLATFSGSSSGASCGSPSPAPAGGPVASPGFEPKGEGICTDGSAKPYGNLWHNEGVVFTPAKCMQICETHNGCVGVMTWPVSVTQPRPGCTLNMEPNRGFMPTNAERALAGIGWMRMDDQWAEWVGGNGVQHLGRGLVASSVPAPFNQAFCFAKQATPPPTSFPGFTNAGQGWCQDNQGRGFRHYRIEQPGITETQCLTQCKNMPECGSINYYPASNICIVDVDHAVSPAGATAPLWTMVSGGHGMHPVASVDPSPDTVCYSKGTTDPCGAPGAARFGCCPQQPWGRLTSYQRQNGAFVAELDICTITGEPHIMDFTEKITGSGQSILEEGDFVLYEGKLLEVSVRLTANIYTDHLGARAIKGTGNNAWTMTGALLGYNTIEYFGGAVLGDGNTVVDRAQSEVFWNGNPTTTEELCRVHLKDYVCSCKWDTDVNILGGSYSDLNRHVEMVFNKEYMFRAATWYAPKGWIDIVLTADPLNAGQPGAKLSTMGGLEIVSSTIAKGSVARGGLCSKGGRVTRTVILDYKIDCASNDAFLINRLGGSMLLHDPAASASFCYRRRVEPVSTSDDGLTEDEHIAKVMDECDARLRSHAEDFCSICDTNFLLERCVFDVCAVGELEGARGSRNFCQDKLLAFVEPGQESTVCDDDQVWDAERTICRSATWTPPGEEPDCFDETFKNTCISSFMEIDGCSIIASSMESEGGEEDIEQRLAGVPRTCFMCENIGTEVQELCKNSHGRAPMQILQEVIQDLEELDTFDLPQMVEKIDYKPTKAKLFALRAAADDAFTGVRSYRRKVKARIKKTDQARAAMKKNK